MANQIGQNMMLVNSTFRNAKSFTLIPVSLDSPYTAHHTQKLCLTLRQAS